MLLSRRATAYQGQGIHTQLLETQLLETNDILQYRLRPL